MKNLSPKQEKFVQEYLIDLNATQAAIRAGYSEKTAQEQSSRLLSNVMVKAAISAAKNDRNERVKVDQDYVLNKIVETVERCSQAAPVIGKDGKPVLVKTPTGEIVPAYAFDAMAVLKGTDQLAKHVGLYEADNKQKAGALAELPREMVKAIVERLKQLNAGNGKPARLD